MPIDEGRLRDLIVESEDLQRDALREMAATLDDLDDIREERRGDGVNLDEIRRYNATRRDVLAGTGLGLGGVAARGLLAGGIGSALVSIVASPAMADKALDVQILQTAASLEQVVTQTSPAPARWARRPRPSASSSPRPRGTTGPPSTPGTRC